MVNKRIIPELTKKLIVAIFVVGHARHSMLPARQLSAVGFSRADRCRPLNSTSVGFRSFKHRSSVKVQASTYTQAAQQAIKHAQQEACRQGSMFLAPPHLLQVGGVLEQIPHKYIS